MKKFTLFLMAGAMIAMSSCGGNKKKAAAVEANPEESFEVQQLEAHIQMQLDSIAAIFTSKAGDPFLAAVKQGKVELSENEKMLKPSYLANPESAAGLTTLAQKYRALAIFAVDSHIAALYEMPDEAYKSAVAKLASDINDPALKKFLEAQSNENILDNYNATVNSLYKDEVKNGRVCLFWEMNGALAIESLYIMSQNIDKFMTVITDEDAANLTFRLFLAKQSVDQLVAYYPELESMSKSLSALDVLNAMDAAQFKSQLTEMKGQLEVIRNGLLK